MPEERCEEVEGRELVDRRRRRQVRRPVGATMRPCEALDVDPRRPGEDVGVAAPRTVRAGAPEPAEQSKVDEPGQATLGSPQLSIGEQRRQLGGDHVSTEEPQQEGCSRAGSPVQLAPARTERSESAFGLGPG